MRGTGRYIVTDFEFGGGDGERSVPRCCVMRIHGTGETHRVWLDGAVNASCPVQFGCDDVLVAYFASAEIGCFLQLGWALPEHILDLYPEFVCAHNGSLAISGRSLLAACRTHGISMMELADKEALRRMALRGGSYAATERDALLDYCEADVVATDALLAKMLPSLDLPRSLLRGRYMASVARMEAEGVPLDQALLRRFEVHHRAIRAGVARRCNEWGEIYEGTSFRERHFEARLRERGIEWPRAASGHLLLDDDTFRAMANLYPELSIVRQTRKFLSATKSVALTVGSDGRNRALLSPFRSGTGRNQPSNTKFIVGQPSFMRGHVTPPEGYVLAYVDYSQQEFAIAASLSDDTTMRKAYESADPYLEFAKQAGLAPPHATKATHGRERDMAKACVLGVQYGMSEQGLAQRLGTSRARAADLLRRHRDTYPRYWAWSEDTVARAKLEGEIRTVFGWRLTVTADTKSRTLSNFPMQANGAEMLRIAIILAHERGVRVCAPVHDALLILAPEAEIAQAIDATRQAMREASLVVLAGFEVRTDVKVIRSGERFLEDRGRAMWELVLGELHRAEADAAACAEARVEVGEVE